MKIDGSVVVITGGGSGIGRALAERCARAGARRVVVVDRDREAADAVSSAIGAEAYAVDVGDEAAVRELIEGVSSAGDIDLFCSNAGIAGPGGVDPHDSVWADVWRVNVMASVYAMRALLPGWRRRGAGHLLITASGAGLGSAPAQLPYTVSKHAAVGLAESLAVRHAAEGIRVSCLCPSGVDTPLFAVSDDVTRRIVGSRVMSADDVASATLEGLAENRFLILPDAGVGEMWRRKAADVEQWLTGFEGIYRAALR